METVEAQGAVGSWRGFMPYCRVKQPVQFERVIRSSGDIGRDMARLTTEVHGGMGLTEFLGLHYWFRRVALNSQLLGAP